MFSLWGLFPSYFGVMFCEHLAIGVSEVLAVHGASHEKGRGEIIDVNPRLCPHMRDPAIGVLLPVFFAEPFRLDRI